MVSQREKELFHVSLIQACHVDIVRWLLHSTRSMHKDKLQMTLSEKIGTPLSFQWMRINDGSPWQKGRNTTEESFAYRMCCNKQPLCQE